MRFFLSVYILYLEANSLRGREANFHLCVYAFRPILLSLPLTIAPDISAGSPFFRIKFLSKKKMLRNKKTQNKNAARFESPLESLGNRSKQHEDWTHFHFHSRLFFFHSELFLLLSCVPFECSSN